MIATDNLTAIGLFGRPHGLKGEISAQIPDTDIDPGELPAYLWNSTACMCLFS